MIGQRHCPFCHTSALTGCSHLALAVEAREFVPNCVELSKASRQWRTLCERRRGALHASGNWSPEREDFMWLETAFCEEFLRHLRWFGGMDYEWRTGPKLEQGGFWVLLWSKDPQRLWWELQDELERQSGGNVWLGAAKGAQTRSGPLGVSPRLSL
jgi:hypothetical protein